MDSASILGQIGMTSDKWKQSILQHINTDNFLSMLT